MLKTASRQPSNGRAWAEETQIDMMSTISGTQLTSRYAFEDTFSRGAQKPGLAVMCLLAADVLGLTAVCAGFLSATDAGRKMGPHGWVHAAPLLLPCLALLWVCGVYKAGNFDPVSELRGVLLATGCTYLFAAGMLAAAHAGIGAALLFVPASVACGVVLALRTVVRRVGSQQRWWGHPTVIIGRGEEAVAACRRLMNGPELGLRPVAMVLDGPVDLEVAGVPVFRHEELIHLAASGIKHAVVTTTADCPAAEIAEEMGNLFTSCFAMPSEDLGSVIGAPGMTVWRQPLSGLPKLAKRVLDLIASLFFLLVLLPVLVAISVAIVLESGFPVFYVDKRLGYRGEVFGMWKFRTMKKDSNNTLARYLAASASLSEEWAKYQKLRKDPRITGLGRLLRKTSLDEVPQLWNILRGEMSIVGPRPRLLEVNVPRYEKVNALYGRTTPGLTGLWQVSGRNRTTYEERLAYDAYYIRNWSLWMDLYLLVRTIRVVVTGYGAY